METLLQDVRYAVAIMRRNPGFTAAGLLTLALGIGATTAVFSIVYGVLLRPLPYRDAERLMRLSEEHPGANSAAARADAQQPDLTTRGATRPRSIGSRPIATTSHGGAAGRRRAAGRRAGDAVALSAPRRDAGARPLLPPRRRTRGRRHRRRAERSPLARALRRRPEHRRPRRRDRRPPRAPSSASRDPGSSFRHSSAAATATRRCGRRSRSRSRQPTPSPDGAGA